MAFGAAPVPPALQAELCPADVPLALLPVRLETRFFQVATGMELRIRVYPDKIHLDSHEVELTAAERQWGVHFWEQCWRAGGVADDEANAWRQLAERYGAPRAGWIARVLRPTNPGDRPPAPVPSELPLSPPPAFPAVAMAPAGEDAAWRRAPLARLLPDHWIAVAYHQGAIALTAVGRDIVMPLAVGPDPSPDTPLADVGDDELAIDPGMRWMVDFEEAEARGMGLRMMLEPTQVAVGIELLLVFGVRGTLPAAKAARELGRLLDAHHYTDGLAFLRFGAPTNNTAELRSAFSSADPGAASSYASEIAPATAAAEAGSNARVLAATLGLPDDALGRVTNAGASTERDARSMNAALWPVTWGYYLTNMVGFEGTGLTVGMVDWARRHFIDNVRGGGPLPAIRCGRQPYGLLPVTSLDLWQPPAGEEVAHAPLVWLRTQLQRLRDNVWRPRLRQVPRLGNTDEPNEVVGQIMRTEALSSSYAIRPLMGRHYVQHLRAFIREDLAANGWIALQETLAVGILQRLNFSGRPRLFRCVYGDFSWPIRVPLVQAGEVSARRPLEPNYIAALLAEPRIDDIAENHVQAGEGASLLHALLRHALLLEYVGAGAAILASAGASLPALLRDAELIDLVGGAPPTLTWRRQLDQRAAAVTGNLTIRQHLESPAGLQGPVAESLREHREALGWLQGRDSEALQNLMQTTIDLASHRLDAWITSFATQRLAALRARHPEGVFVGAYGWVENFHGRGLGTPLQTLPPDEPGPLFAQPGDTGFIHAPSITQAATAALLRNAHLGHDGVAQADAPLAIDLSSRRLRLARWLLDGVRQGQPLGALLGYRFERRLHELQLDVEIARFRRIAPLVAGKLETTDLPAESIAANNVVDGLRLFEKWRSDRASLLPVNAALEGELDALGEAIDAASDALAAESAYQVVRGNPSRIASSLSAITQGEAAVPELDVGRTPRTGTALTHRMALLFTGPPAAPPGWGAPLTSMRARVEPILNGWAARLFGNPRKLRCVVERLDDGDEVLETIEVPLSELKLAPIDVVYSVDASPRGAGASVLEQRLLYHLRHRAGGVGDAARLQVRQGRPPDAPPGDLFLSDVIQQARALRRLLTGARSLDATDLDLPERATSGTLDLAGLTTRVTNAETTLRSLRTAITRQLQKGPDADAESLRGVILRCDGFGLVGAVPAVASGDDAGARGALAAQLALLLKEVEARLARGVALAAQMPTVDAADSTQALRRHLAERLEVVFGAGFIAMPAFTCGNGAELSAALADSTAVQGGDSLAVVTWLERGKRAREPLGRLSALLRGAEVLETGERLRLSVAQLPHEAGARWVGLPPAPDAPLPHGRLSLVLQTLATFTPEQVEGAPLQGLLVDEWVEVVPNRDETTAIAFQTDPPNACAPQAVLLAVPPVVGRPWTGMDLARVLTETLDLAKLRAVDAESLGELGQYMPALYFGFNAADDAVSTDFGPLS
jgi:hypothetical protein